LIVGDYGASDNPAFNSPTAQSAHSFSPVQVFASALLFFRSSTTAGEELRI
jgi:hypothetical protein